MTLISLCSVSKAANAQSQWVRIAQLPELPDTPEERPSQLPTTPELPPESEPPTLTIPATPERENQRNSDWDILVENINIEPFKKEGISETDRELTFSLEDLEKISIKPEFKENSQTGLREIDCHLLTNNNTPISVVTPENSINMSLSQLLDVAEAVRAFYHCQGYQTSTARINIPSATEDRRRGPVTIQVIEGYLPAENIQVSRQVTEESQHQRLNSGYVRSQLNLSDSGPLNLDELQERLQLLQLDPLIQNVSASLADGDQRGESRLLVNFIEANPFSGQVSFNNSRSPSIGTFERQAQFNFNNPLGFGDRIRAEYSNTDGSDALNLSYQVPINSRQGTLQFRFNTSSNDIVEPPFDDIDADGIGPDIKSNAQTYDITLRQPLSRRIRARRDEDRTRRTFEEFTIGLTGSLRNSRSTLLGLPFPAAGSDANGRTRIAALRFFQEWTKQDATEILALRSQFNLGLDAFDSTINESIPGSGSIPDSRFFSWQGQAQWLRRLGTDTFLLVRGTSQLADQPLLSAEQFALGGYGSVRGYRQDLLQTDNGLFASAEVQVPVIRIPELEGVLQVVPFVDAGTIWSNSGTTPDPNTLASVGLGLRWQQGDRLTGRLDYGIPLISVESRDRTWQENGIYLTVQYDLF